MRIAIISDIHAQTAGLSGAGDDVDLFVCLGDLILFLDYDDPSQGIFPDIYGEEFARRYIALRTANRWQEARELTRSLAEQRGIDTWSAIAAGVDRQYEQLFAQLPDGLFIYGNVDVPSKWPAHQRPGQQLVDGTVVERDGLRLGFIGGGLPSPMRTPYEIPEEDFDAKIDAVGDVDVLFSHIPPDVPEITYDIAARRFERGSAGLLRAIRRWQPRYVFHGHVHTPLAARHRIGRTEVVNVGHYRKRRAPLVVSIDPGTGG